MIPRLFPRAGLAATAALALVLTGCTPAASDDAEPSSSVASSPPGVTEAVAPLASRPSNTLEAGDPATVIRVLDGDTVDVRRGEEEVRVRLLNVDTPETKHPSKAVQCLGPEAAELLESLLQPGDDVVLRYDQERLDRYGRTLAGVYEDEVLVNAEIARAGLGVPVVFEPNRRFHPEVLAAWNEAEAEGAGLHEPGLECSLPALVDPVTPGEPPAQSEIDELTAVLAAVATGDQAWMEVHYEDVLPRVKQVVSDHDRRVAKAEADAAEQRRAEAERAEAAERAAAEREAARQAAAEAERQAEAEREAEREAEEQRRAEERAAEEDEAEARAADEAEADTTALGWADTSSGGSDSSGSGDVYYANCDDARAAGAAPLHLGEPGYRSGMDGDGDGIACEPYRGSGSGGSDYGVAASGGPVSGSGNVCPEGYPVKVSNSGKYHVPGGRSYDNTGSKRCYASTAAAEADGAVAAKG